MKRLILLSLIFLAACGPRVTATIGGSGGHYTVVVAAEDALYDVRLSVLDAKTDAPGCTRLGADVICSFDALTPGTVVTLEVEGTPDTACRVGGFTRLGDLTSYRSINCRVV